MRLSSPRAARSTVARVFCTACWFRPALVLAKRDDPVALRIFGNGEQVRLGALAFLELIDAHDDSLAGLDRAAVLVGGLFDPPLDVPLLDGIDHAAQAIDGLDEGLRLPLQLVGQGFEEIAAPRGSTVPVTPVS